MQTTSGPHQRNNKPPRRRIVPTPWSRGSSRIEDPAPPVVSTDLEPHTSATVFRLVEGFASTYGCGSAPDSDRLTHCGGFSSLSHKECNVATLTRGATAHQQGVSHTFCDHLPACSAQQVKRLPLSYGATCYVNRQSRTAKRRTSGWTYSKSIPGINYCYRGSGRIAHRDVGQSASSTSCAIRCAYNLATDDRDGIAGQRKVPLPRRGSR